MENIIVGNNSIALAGAKEKAMEFSFPSVITSSSIAGDVRRVAADMAAFACEELKGISKGEKRCYLSGGETTVRVEGKGKGGRNMELALEFARLIEGRGGITLLSAGTDGTDGPTDAAGALVDGNSVSMAMRDGYDSDSYLKNNDSYNFFKNAGGLIKTGPTGTNVMDIQILILENE